VVNWLIDLVGAVGVLLLSWLLFPAVVTMILGLFLERVAAAVEAGITDLCGRQRLRSISENRPDIREKSFAAEL